MTLTQSSLDAPGRVSITRTTPGPSRYSYGSPIEAKPIRDLPAPGRSLPCQAEDADLWFAERPAELARAQQLCQQCPAQEQCLKGALQRREPWGVWGGQIFERGQMVLFKRKRGRPAKPRHDVAAASRLVVTAMSA